MIRHARPADHTAITEINTLAFGKPVFFTGMRTDTGIFFSHHTIGLAYDSALACISRLH